MKIKKPHERSNTMWKKPISLFFITILFAVPAFAADDRPSGPSIALPPAQVILNASKEMGIEVVDLEYVKSKIPDLINQTGKVFVIDARPARNYDEGHIPTAFSMFDAKFDQIYPEFQKLNIPKDTEIILGIGRPCPMSLSDAKQLKEKGYTNFKAFVKGPVWVETQYNEVTAKGAQKYLGVGAVLVDLAADPDLSKFSSAGVPKDKAVVVAGPLAGFKANNAAAQKIFGLGYQKLYLYNGEIASLTPAKGVKAASVAPAKADVSPVTAGGKISAVKPGKGEGEIDKEFFRKIAEEKPTNVLFVDVRTPFEYAAAHLDGARHIYINDMFKKGCESVVSQFPNESYVVFICATGARAGEMYFGMQDQCKNQDMSRIFYLDAEVAYTGGKANVK
ncbi:MAG: rhodanese-like domain-containing protein [Desulfobacteraceae bacterium]|nr:MAG: rhodanese-like domain-containing protein [Desulfobacteraceae bacterium]